MDRKQLRAKCDRAAAVSTQSFIAEAKTAIPALLDEVESLEKALDHAISENFAFNVKVATEINEARAERDSLRVEVERLRERLNSTIEQRDANPARYWAERELKTGADGLRIPTLADCDVPKKHLRDALREVDSLRAALAEVTAARDEWKRRAVAHGCDAEKGDPDCG